MPVEPLYLWHAGLRRAYEHLLPPFRVEVFKYKNVSGIPVNSAPIFPARAPSFKLLVQISVLPALVPFHSFRFDYSYSIIEGQASRSINSILSNPSD